MKFGYQNQNATGMLSPKTEGDMPGHKRRLDGSAKGPTTDQKTEPGFPGGDSTTDG